MNMDAATFFLICFVVGFTLSLVSFLSGFSHWHLPAKWHFPHGGFHHAGSAAHLPAHIGSPGAGHIPSHSGSAGELARSEPGVSPFNFMTLMAFLAWFGGTGYLLTRYYRFWFLLALGIATLGGLVGAGTVFFFLVKVLMPHERVLDPADYEMVGTVAKISSSIREGGTGEIIYSQEGVRRTSGARSEDGTAIPKGVEVVITRYDKGLAYVKRWEDWTR